MKVCNDISAVSRLLLTSVNTISDDCVTIGTVVVSVIVVSSGDVVDGVNISVVDELATAVVVITPLDTMESAVDIAVDG